MKVKNLLWPAILVWLGGIAAWTAGDWITVLFYIIGGMLFSGGVLLNQANHYNHEPQKVVDGIAFIASKIRKP